MENVEKELLGQSAGSYLYVLYFKRGKNERNATLFFLKFSMIFLNITVIWGSPFRLKNFV